MGQPERLARGDIAGKLLSAKGRGISADKAVEELVTGEGIKLSEIEAAIRKQDELFVAVIDANERWTTLRKTDEQR